jgi:PD-(D/E)XK nuclease superfamily
VSSGHVVSYSEISTFRLCPHKHDLAYRQRWVAPEESPALRKGKLFHLVLENHYKALRQAQRDGTEVTADDLMRVVAPLLYNPETGDWYDEVAELVGWMYAGYVQHWGIERERILAVEYEAEVPLPTLTGRRSRFYLKMKLDLITEDGMGRRWIWDHKTGRDLPTERELAIDDQFGLYIWGLRSLNKRIFGTIYNAARTQRNVSKAQPLDERFSRTLLYRTDEELNTIAKEAFLTASRAYAIKPGLAERAPDSDLCRWKCSFTESCLAGRKGLDEVAFMLDRGYVQDWTRH